MSERSAQMNVTKTDALLVRPANPTVLAIVYNSSAPRLNLQSGAEIATLIYTEESEEAGSSAS